VTTGEAESKERPGGWRRRLDQVPDAIAAAMLLALCVITVVDVFGRYLFRSPIRGADELTVFFMAISVFAVLATVTWREDHVCVDIIDLFYPRRWIALRQILINLVAAVFMVLATWRVWAVAARLSEDGEVTEYLRLDRGLLTYFFAAMCAASVLALLVNCVRYALGRGPQQRRPPSHGGSAG
jgi:TRAP-type C4-dicarboxylate transport system permease small subunit